MTQVFDLFLLAVSLNAAKPDGFIRIPLLFEENRGQAPNGAFLVHSGNAEIRFGKSITYRAANAEYSVTFSGANQQSTLHPEQPHPARVNYYRGSLRAEAVPAYEALRYRRLYPGIDLLYHGRTGELEYDFQVAPGADPRRIQLHFSGTQSISLSPEGDLIVKSANEIMRHKRPIAWQDIEGRRTLVPAWFRLDGDTIRFALAPYNRRHPLTIDPVLKFATVLSTAVSALASDSAGNTFLAGSPVVSSTADTEVFILKLDPTGKLLYRTILGGYGADRAAGIAVDAQGSLFVAGHSESPNFPVSGAPCSALQSDAFLSKLGATGILLASRCYGGIGVETSAGIGLDNAGAPYIAGTTTSQDLPTTSPTVQSQKLVPASNSGFLAKFDPSNLALVYGTYLGNNASITISSLAVDPTGAAIVAGTSTAQGFRLTPGAYQTTTTVNHFSAAPFVLKVNSAGTALVYSTWLPTASPSFTSPIAAGVDESGQAIVAYPASFPGSSFPLQIVKLNAQGTGALLEKPVYYFSQPGPMHIDRLGNVLLGGQSSDLNAITPTNDSLQGRPSLHAVVKLSPDLSSVQHIGLVNGQVSAVASGPSNDILVAYNDSFNAASPASPVTPGAYSENPRFIPPFAVYRLTQGSTCSPALAPSTNFTLPTTGGSGTLQVVAPDNCTWIATSSNTFLFQFTGTRTGTGNGSIPYAFSPIPGNEPGRVFTLRLSATVSYEFTQGQPPACQASLGSISRGAHFLHYQLPRRLPVDGHIQCPLGHAIHAGLGQRPFHGRLGCTAQYGRGTHHHHFRQRSERHPQSECL